jgi:hypothetical protein
MALKLFEYAIIQQPLKDKGGKVVEDGSILVGVNTVLARDVAHAQMIAAREVPDEAMEDIERLEVVVRPFERTKVLGIAELNDVPESEGPDFSAFSKGNAFTAYSMVTPTSSSYTPMSIISNAANTGGTSLWVPKVS